MIKKTPVSHIAHKFYYKLGFRSQNSIYDEQLVEIMKHCLQEDSVCIDAGANTGQILGKIVAQAPKARHFAFEPIPTLANLVREKYPNLYVYEIALSNKQGKVEFQYFENMSGYSGLGNREIHATAEGFKPKTSKILVETDTLDNVIPVTLRVDFIKFDIEGAEYLAMLGGVNTIVRSKPIIVFEAEKDTMSLFDIKPENIYDFLIDNCHLKVSSMQRWLNDKPEYSRKDFCKSINFHLCSYFIAYPENSTTL
jgi:FkbM family methyltransferase